MRVTVPTPVAQRIIGTGNPDRGEHRAGRRAERWLRACRQETDRVGEFDDEAAARVESMGSAESVGPIAAALIGTLHATRPQCTFSAIEAAGFVPASGLSTKVRAGGVLLSIWLAHQLWRRCQHKECNIRRDRPTNDRLALSPLRWACCRIRGFAHDHLGASRATSAGDQPQRELPTAPSSASGHRAMSRSPPVCRVIVPVELIISRLPSLPLRSRLRVTSRGGVVRLPLSADWKPPHRRSERCCRTCHTTRGTRRLPWLSEPVPCHR